MTLDDERKRISAFEHRAKALLKESVASTGPQMRARVARIRERALLELEREPRPAPRMWIPATGVAVLATAAIIMNVGEQDAAAPARLAAVPADDVALLLNADNLDLLEQMEFYVWLDREPGALEDDAAPPKPARRS